MISGGFEGNLIYCRLKFWRQSRQNAHNGRAKLAVFAGVLRDLKKWSQKARFEFFMESKNRRSAENSERSGVCDDVKVKFPLYVFPETMQKIDMLYEADNCKSKTEFIEKAIRFYCGYLLNKDSVAAEYAAPQITAITEGIVKGTEQRLSRALFKVAVELGAVSHMLAAINDIDDETMVKLRAMCTDEVRKINGVINFERAVRYQRADL